MFGVAQVALTASLFDLSLEVMKGDVIKGVIQYSADLFGGETAARMAGHFKVSRHCCCSRPQPRHLSCRQLVCSRTPIYVSKYVFNPRVLL